jgi:hypothetical protein
MSVVLILLYFGNSTIRYIYDLNDCGEYVKFYSARNVVYEIMFFLFCMIGFYNTKGLTKALLCFLGVMIFGSVIDKAIFKITYYIYTDIIIGIIAICTSYTIYNHGRRVERT